MKPTSLRGLWLGLLAAALSPAVFAATFTVTSTNNSGAGTLRDAITNANAAPGPDVIAFNLPPATLTLSPTTALPAITEPLTIDGATQPGFAGRPLVELSGAAAPGGVVGLRLTTSNSLIRGLVINRWRASGIELAGGGGHVIEGNLLGLGTSGTSDLGNSASGILITDSAGNRIGGATPGTGNVISGNDDHGIRLAGTNSVGNQVLGNIIGLDETGATDLGNTDHGIFVDKAVGTIIGDATPETGNLISGNNGHGIRLEGVGAREAVIRNNVIGPDRTGLLDRGNNLDGISISGVPNIEVSAGNLVSGNGGAGIRVDGLTATNTVILGNRIGTDATGLSPLANTGAGIEIANNARFNRVGGTAPAEANVLAFNGGDGVFISGGTNNAVRGNSHFGNGGLGLDLGSNGVQANDATDADSGANQLQNFPILTRAVLHPGRTEISGELRSRPATVFELDFFASETADPSGNGEGQQFLGTIEVTTDAAGLAAFTAELPVPTARRFLTGTATDPPGNTSEFSPALRALTTLTPNSFSVTTADDAGPGSLRQAIQEATNAYNLGDRITFNIPGDGPHMISPVTALPVLTAPVTLDGYTQPGASANTAANGFDAVLKIILDGNAAPGSTDGLSLQTQGAVVRGLIIQRFKGDGIELGATAKGSTVEGCVIGLGPDGTDLGQLGSGILLNGAANNRIGGSTPAARNVISGNNRHGIELVGLGATGNRIEGNWIGLGLDGQLDRGNSQQGIRADNAPANFLGGPVVGAGNRIAGNDQNGIEFANVGASNNVVLGNFIGLTAGGEALKNNFSGVAVSAVGTRIGGTNVGEANWIAFNGQRGVNVLAGTNSAIRGNRIFANDGLGLDLGNNNRTGNDPGDADAGANQLQNFPVLTSGVIEPGLTRITGTLNSRAAAPFQLDFFASATPDPTGSGEGAQYLGSAEVSTDDTGHGSFNVALPVAGTGRYLSATATDAFGNTSEFATNLVAASTQPAQTFAVSNTLDAGPGSLRQALLDADATVAGSAHLIRFNIPGDGPHIITLETSLPVPVTEAVVIDGFTQPGARANTVSDGSDAVLKVVLDGTDRLVDHGLRFVVPGNTVRGLSVVSFRQNGLLLGGGSNRVEGCFIGLLPDGTPKPNQGAGIVLAKSVFGTEGSSGNRIGGTAPTARNVISGQGFGAGIAIAGGGSNNVVFGNYVGTDPAGLIARPNRFGVSINGVNASDNRIGGPEPGAGNLISGQSSHGIRLSSSERTLIQGNRIGVDRTGTTALPNADNGITVSSSPGTIIGGVAAGTGNRIAFNGRSGIELEGTLGSTNLTVRGNAIFDNGQLGFDLGGFGLVEFNDVGDTDSGPNFRQNFPVITAATVEPASTRIAGTLDTLPGGTYALDFFASPTADASGHGEGAQYLGSTTVLTDSSGDASFEVTFPVAALGLFITATATDPAGNTSEFSAALQAQSTVGGQTYGVTNTNDSGPGSLRQAILDSNANPTSGNRIEFNIPGGGPHVLQPLTPLPAFLGAVTLDGYSQPGARANTLPNGNDAVLLIHLDAPPTGFGAGLTLSDRQGVVRGLAITGFSPGVSLKGTNNTVTGCFIGLRPDGTERGNGYGLLLENSRGNTVGGSTPADRNVISGNRLRGVAVFNSADCVISGNFIGTDPAGLVAQANENSGITASSSPGLIVGGPTAASRNVIGGHAFTGVEIDGQTGHLIANNIIGLGADGLTPLPNGTGLSLNDSAGSRIAANLISRNSSRGVFLGGTRDGNNIVTANFIGTDATGTIPLGNGGPGLVITSTTAVQVGGVHPGEGNTIAFNTAEGVTAASSASSAVAVRGNRIFSNGALGLERGAPGVTPNDPVDADHVPNFPELTAATINATDVQLSGLLKSAPAQNCRLDFYASVTPDPTGFGEGAQFLGSHTNTTDAAGQFTFNINLPAVAIGRWITATSTDPSGDTSEFGPAFRAESTRPPAGFVVTTTADSGPGSLRQALLDAGAVIGSTNSQVSFNIPGPGPRVIAPVTPLPTPMGTVTLDGFTQPGSAANPSADRDDAVRLIEVSGANLGAATGLRLESPGNVIRGLVLRDWPGAALELRGDSNLVEGCLIVSNQTSGIAIATGRGNQIGGPLPPQRNRLQANSPDAITISLNAGAGTRIQGNFIGVAADGVLNPQDFATGVRIAATGPSVVGGSGLGEGNRIAVRGVSVEVSGGQGHTVRGNPLAAEGSRFIDLPPVGFANVNDEGDADVGANELQNHPVLTVATAVPAGTRVMGSLNSRPAAAFTLDFYSSTSNQLALVQYLGAASVTTDVTGNAPFNVVLPVPTIAGRVYATATSAEGSTSETSAPVFTGTEIPPPTFTVTTTADRGPGSLRQALLDANTVFATGQGTIAFDLPGAKPHLIELESPLPVLTQGTLIDGFTQPDSSPGTDPERTDAMLTVQLHGGNAGPSANGLELTGSGHVVRGLIFTGFGGTGLRLREAPGARVEQNWFGYDGVTGVATPAAEGLDPRSRSGIRPATLSSEADLKGGTAIEIIGKDLAFQPPQSTTELLRNLVVNQNVAGVSARHTSDLRGLGNRIGVLLDGQPFGNPLPVGLSLEAVERIEVIRGPAGSDGENTANRIAGCTVAIKVKTGRSVKIDDNVIGGGEWGQWSLANKLGLDLEDVSVSEVLGNRLSYNFQGFKLRGEGFGTLLGGNWLGDNPRSGGFIHSSATGYRLGELRPASQNFFGRGAGSLLAVNSPKVTGFEYNRYGAFGSPLFLGREATPLAAPVVELNPASLQVSGFTADSFDRIILHAGDAWGQFLAPQGNVFLEGGQTSVTQPLSGPLATVAGNRPLAALFAGANSYSATGFRAAHAADLAIKVFPLGSLGPGEAGTSRQLFALHFLNPGPLEASFLATLTASSSTGMITQLPRQRTDTGFELHWMPPVRGLDLGPTEARYTGRLGPGAEHVEQIEVSLPPGATVSGSISGTDSTDPNPADNAQSTGFPGSTVSGTPADLGLRFVSSAPTPVLGAGTVQLIVENLGSTPASAFRLEAPVVAALNWSPSETSFYRTELHPGGLRVTPKFPLAAGASLEVTLNFTAGSHPGYFNLPLAVTEFEALTAMRRPWDFATVEIVDPTKRDFGDAPASYGTLGTDNGPSHLAAPGYELGFQVSFDAEVKPAADALGDNDDGIHFPEPFIPGQRVTFEVQASALGRLDAWVDWNRNGVFEHRPAAGLNEYLGDILEGPTTRPGESYFLQPGLNRLRFVVPATAAPGPTYARFRFSQTGGLGPLGPGGAGEVEDHRIEIYSLPPDLGDAPDFLEAPGYPTLPIHGGAIHYLTPDSPRLGVARDAESDAPMDAVAFGDDAAFGTPFPVTGLTDDEDGVTLLGFLVPGQSANIRVVATIPAGGNARLDAWIDWNADFDWNDPGEQVATSLEVAGGTNTFSILAPATAIPGFTYARIRISQNGGLAPGGAVEGGEVEDYQVAILPPAECRITSINRQVNQVLIFWSGSATLEQGSSLTGPWTSVPDQFPGSAVVTMTTDGQFFRLQCQ